RRGFERSQSFTTEGTEATEVFTEVFFNNRALTSAFFLKALCVVLCDLCALCGETLCPHETSVTSITKAIYLRS
ncbi:MAG: hypothetical protein WBZ29_09355, partial [Methanocella sp.]